MARFQHRSPPPAADPIRYGGLPPGTAAMMHDVPEHLAALADGPRRVVTMTQANYDRLRTAEVVANQARSLLLRLRRDARPHPAFVELARAVAAYDRAAMRL